MGEVQATDFGGWGRGPKANFLYWIKSKSQVKRIESTVYILKEESWKKRTPEDHRRG